MQSRIGLHVAVVMDGNGRWATRRGLPRGAGHAAGIVALRRAVEAAPTFGIAALTVFAFSADNWRRPAAEVAVLMELLEDYLARDAPCLAEAGVRLEVIGRRDRLARPLVAEIEAAETATAAGTALRLRVAVDYSAREAIRTAALSALAVALAEDGSIPAGPAARFAAAMGGDDVDLLIRTGGERRLSDFLLWECAYAELRFTDECWPDFDAASLAAAMRDYRSRTRRFGGLPPEPADTRPAIAPLDPARAA